MPNKTKHIDAGSDIIVGKVNQNKTVSNHITFQDVNILRGIVGLETLSSSKAGQHVQGERITQEIKILDSDLDNRTHTSQASDNQSRAESLFPQSETTKNQSDRKRIERDSISDKKGSTPDNLSNQNRIGLLDSSLKAGESAAQFYADFIMQGKKEGGVKGAAKQSVGWIGGVLSSLWTRETAVDTLLTIGTTGLASLANLGRLGVASKPVARAIATLGSFDSGVALTDAVQGRTSGASISDMIRTLQTGNSQGGRELSQVERALSGGLSLISILGPLRVRFLPLNKPIGISETKWSLMLNEIKNNPTVQSIDGDVFVHGSRIDGAAINVSDIDIKIKVSKSEFYRLQRMAFPDVRSNNSRYRTYSHTFDSGKISSKTQRLKIPGFRQLRKKLEKIYGKKNGIDLSIILEGGPFDTAPEIPIR